MRKDSKPSVFKSSRSPWQNELKAAYNSIYKDAYDSKMLQRFPVLRQLKDSGRDVRLKTSGHVHN
jgi:hypothetical protein